MSLYRIKPWVAVLLLALLTGAPAHAQGLRDMQLFAPVEIDEFGGGPRADQGLFFQFDWLYWWIHPPETETIGKQGLTRLVFDAPDESYVQHNTLSNSNLTAQAEAGQRFEFGYVHEHDGLMMSIFDLQHQGERLTYSDVDIVFDDQPTGPNNQPRLFGFVADILEADDAGATYYNMVLRDLPVTFDEVFLKNEVDIWGTEVDYIYRTHPGGHGGIFELLMGVRYFQFDETFSFEGYGNRFVLINRDPEALPEEISGAPAGTDTLLADSFWHAIAQNHIIGPQLGVRWFRQSKRWTWSTEARFFAGLNLQNLKQAGELGTKLNDSFPGDAVLIGPATVADLPYQPLTFGPVGYKHSAYEEEFSPGIELRIDLKYKLTHAVDFRVGWTGLWIDGIARASNLIDYSLTETSIMGLDLWDNRQGVFMHGLTLGFDINR